MYIKPWITNLSAILAMLASIAGAASGTIDFDQATSGFLAGGAVLGLGRKLESIRKAVIIAGAVASASKPK